MPQTSPIGGLSIIIHIIINVIVFTYNKAVKAAGLSKNNSLSKFFNRLNSAEGETTARKVLAYSLILFIFLAMSSNFILITFGISNLDQEKTLTSSQEVDDSQIILEQRIIEQKIIEQINLINTASISILELLNLNQEILSDQNILTQKIEKADGMQLIDFLESLGIVDSSFKNRAFIAKQLGVISNEEEYNGSPKQNRNIVEKLKQELITHLENKQID